MPDNLCRQLLSRHLSSGEMVPGSEIGLTMKQALLQDVLGSLVMLELEAMGIERAKTNPSVQYIDHALVQADEINADCHRFLKSACARFGIIYSAPGNGISHPVHMARFGIPGESLIGSDSHTPAAGALGMLALGAGGIEVAMAMAGKPLYLEMPKVWGIKLVGTLPDWVSAKDVILEMLRRHGVAGGKGYVLEYFGPGIDCLSAMDRHVIANMGAEMGATTSVFPSDSITESFLAANGRHDDWRALEPEPGCPYDREEVIDLSALEPLIALPSSPGNVVPVTEAAGSPISQAYIGSSANPGYRDFAVVAQIVRGKRCADSVSLDINPGSRSVLLQLTSGGELGALISAGARIHQAGCNGCIGMGQAPATGQNSLRTVPRNFSGRSGTTEDSVFLCSPETAAASAITGVITDPRTLDIAYPKITEPDSGLPQDVGFVFPDLNCRPQLQFTRHTPMLPELDPLPDEIDVPVLMIMGDDITTDDIVPAGKVLPFWSDVFETGKHAFAPVAPDYAKRAREMKGGHAIVAGHNYGQGSSRENAALVPRILGLRVVIAQSFARIHWQNLVSFGVLPLLLSDSSQLPVVGERVRINNLHRQLRHAYTLLVDIVATDETARKLTLDPGLSERQIEILISGCATNFVRSNT